MAVLKASDSAGVPDLDAGVYQAVVDEIEETTGKSFNDPNVEVPRLHIIYKLPEEDNLKLHQWVTLYETLTPKQALYPIVSGVLYAGAPIPKDDEIDTDELVGKPCQLVWGSFTKKDNTQGMGITQVLPPRKRTRGGMSDDQRTAALTELNAQ